jgi:undecaprenyl-diphosphatase
MTVFQALLLGLLQGLTEFLPVSSSGHLELGKHLLHTAQCDNLAFALTVHAATF